MRAWQCTEGGDKEWNLRTQVPLSRTVGGAGWHVRLLVFCFVEPLGILLEA